jgi:hypothetical protein
MKNMPSFFTALGIVLVLLGIFLRLTNFPIIIGQVPVQSISLIILANTAFLLAIVLKK